MKSRLLFFIAWVRSYLDGGIEFDGSEKLFQIRTRFFFSILTIIIFGLSASIPFNLLNGETIPPLILFLTDLLAVGILVFVYKKRNRINSGIIAFGFFFPLLQSVVFFFYPNLNAMSNWAPLGSILAFFLLGSVPGAIVTGLMILFVSFVYIFANSYIISSEYLFGEQYRAWVIIVLITLVVIRKLESDDRLILAQKEDLIRDNRELQDLKKALEEWNTKLVREVKHQVQSAKEQEATIFRQARLASLGEMLQAIAHQWRQPLSVVSMILQDIDDAQDTGELTPEYMKQSLVVALQQLSHMSQTIDDFLDAARPEKEKKRFHPREVVESVFSIVSAQMKFNGITLRYEALSPECDSTSICGFRRDLEHTLTNIILNAKDAICRKKESEESSDGWILVESDVSNGSFILNVKDSGGGISEADIDKIFDPYFTTRLEGTGIGLYMAKTMLEKGMNGTISATNGEEGAVFSLRIPVCCE